MTEPMNLDAAAYTALGTPRDRVALPGSTFDGTVNVPVMHQAVKAFLANQRQGTHATKTRRWVVGGNQKPWKQKGTGRARAGSIRSPLWPGGGTIFGPQPRSYAFHLPGKGKRGAIVAALAHRIQDGALVVVDALSASEIKTRAAAGLLKTLGVDGKALIVDVHPEEKFALSVRNVAGVRMLPSNRVSARDVMDTRKVVLTQAALEKLQEVLS